LKNELKQKKQLMKSIQRNLMQLFLSAEQEAVFTLTTKKRMKLQKNLIQQKNRFVRFALLQAL
jgi:tRNA(Glu) U13 pseudouridine synthase TruD